VAAGPFSHISPKLAVVLIGMNNSNGDDNTAEEIADGMIAVCGRLHTQFPDMRILFLGIFPREPLPCAQREKIVRANGLASRIADGETIHYLDLSRLFLLEDGTLKQELMPDFLHPNEKGYRIWAEAMEPKIAELMGEK
jgi:lysophospholipase L1-like esterase